MIKYSENEKIQVKKMQIKISDGVVDLSGTPILTKINIEITTESKIGIVGRNGCGKTTLLRLLSGELVLSKDNPELNSRFIVSGKPVIGTLSQMAFSDDSITLLDEIRGAYKEIIGIQKELSALQKQMDSSPTDDIIASYTSLLELFTNLGGFYFEREYELALKQFGFSQSDKAKKLSEFSGGQRTKIAFLKLLLSKPDLLLLDEPTNHLDVDAVSWLEDYLSSYKKAVVIVSHDRMFLDKTVNIIYEIEHGKTYRYIGNYTAFVAQKELLRQQQAKQYEAQQKEIARLRELFERFRYKPTKAAMAMSKLKEIERMELIEPPESYDLRTFHADFQPTVRSVNDVLTVKNLQIGYTEVLSTVSFEIKRGEKIGILGGNGLGKSTLLKTLVGTLPPLGGQFIIGGSVKIGYFDQQMAQYTSSDTVFTDFLKAFPNLSDFEARSALGAFQFSGEDVFKKVDMLSGGEKVRLALCKIFKNKPNFLILDEPTNHMDILGKETLESMLAEYEGTVLFVSHDRYFVKKVAQKILSFEGGNTVLYSFGYDEYESKRMTEATQPAESEEKTLASEPKAKKSYSTPLKEKAKRERALKKAEDEIERLELRLNEITAELEKEEVQSDYLAITALQEEMSELSETLEETMELWERLAAECDC